MLQLPLLGWAFYDAVCGLVHACFNNKLAGHSRPTPPAHAPVGHGARWTQAPPARRWSPPRSAQCRGTAVPAAASTRPPARLRPTALPAGGAAPGWAPDGDTRSMGQHACIMSRRFAPCGSRCGQQMWWRAAHSHDWRITQAGREDVEGGGAAHLGGQRGLSGSQSLIPAQRTVALQRALSTLQAACKSSAIAGAARAAGLQGRAAAGKQAPQPTDMLRGAEAGATRAQQGTGSPPAGLTRHVSNLLQHVQLHQVRVRPAVRLHRGRCREARRHTGAHRALWLHHALCCIGAGCSRNTSTMCRDTSSQNRP